MELTPDKRKLIGLVEAAHQGRICLPDFQRDFVWTRSEVADLLRSVLRGYFIGSLLLLRCDPKQPPFKPTWLQGAKPKLSEPEPELLVLDGQQRLTALIYALTAPELLLKDSSKRRWFFVDLDRLVEDPDDDLIVFDRALNELDGLDRREAQWQQRALPCTVLLRPEEYLEWRDGVDDWLREQDPEGHSQFKRKWRRVWDNHIMSTFQTFEIPVVELPRAEDAQSIARVCAIFEKLNSTGVELSVYDLLTARLYPKGIRLRELWEKACKEHQLLAEWSEGKVSTYNFGVLVLRTLALLRGLEPKPRILIDLDPTFFEKDWERAVAAVERALELLSSVSQDGFGVFDHKWLPGAGFIPVLAALRAVIEDRNLGHKEREDLRRWYWCNVFLERFSSGVESKSRKDYSEMLGYWLEGKAEPTVFAEAKARLGADGYSIRDSASYASAVYSGVFCLLALRGARDWAYNESIELQTLQDHHIVPRDYLKEHGFDLRKQKSIVNSIVNRTLISDKTNALIKNKAPAEYIKDKRVFPKGHSCSLLEPHFLNESAISCLSKITEGMSDVEAAAMYERFCAMRECAIVGEIRRVCGVPA